MGMHSGNITGSTDGCGTDGLNRCGGYGGGLRRTDLMAVTYIAASFMHPLLRKMQPIGVIQGMVEITITLVPGRPRMNKLEPSGFIEGRKMHVDVFLFETASQEKSQQPEEHT